MIYNLFDMLFGCTHANYSFPITAKGAHRNIAAAGPTGTYVVYLDCGKEFAYDWDGMQIGRQVAAGKTVPVSETQPVFAKH